MKINNANGLVATLDVYTLSILLDDTGVPREGWVKSIDSATGSASIGVRFDY